MVLQVVVAPVDAVLGSSVLEPEVFYILVVIESYAVWYLIETSLLREFSYQLPIGFVLFTSWILRGRFSDRDDVFSL